MARIRRTGTTMALTIMFDPRLIVELEADAHERGAGSIRAHITQILENYLAMQREGQDA